MSYEIPYQPFNSIHPGKVIPWMDAFKVQLVAVSSVNLFKENL
jgi:hypothetical protein